jgi:hypothetical protein
MQWLAVLMILSLAIGLRSRAAGAAHALLVLGLVVLVSVWYLQL